MVKLLTDDRMDALGELVLSELAKITDENTNEKGNYEKMMNWLNCVSVFCAQIILIANKKAVSYSTKSDKDDKDKG